MTYLLDTGVWLRGVNQMESIPAEVLALLQQRAAIFRPFDEHRSFSRPGSSFPSRLVCGRSTSDRANIDETITFEICPSGGERRVCSERVGLDSLGGAFQP